MKINRRFLISSALGIVAVIVLIVILTSRGNSSTSTNPASSGASTTTKANGSVTTTSLQSTATTFPPGPYTTPSMPLSVEAQGNTKVNSGDVVTVRAEPNAGSLMYGVDARLCRGDVGISNEGAFRPTVGGNCIIDPLSPGTDAVVNLENANPSQGLDVEFRVATGTTTFKTQSGKDATVTCGPANPCQIVLKLQYPNGFGFQGIPVTFR
ncbi:MAG: hypothetical protein JHC63_04720 [Acidimicrobiia bacterium]|nr:hypothetical protein [Acidimicrobiia bacterium]